MAQRRGSPNERSDAELGPVSRVVVVSAIDRSLSLVLDVCLPLRQLCWKKEWAACPR